MHDREIEEFVNGLRDARGFEVQTTAAEDWMPEGRLTEDMHGWLEAAFGRCLVPNYLVRRDEPLGTAVIEGSDRGRLYVQSPCEADAWFRERLGREAHLADDPWMFVLLPWYEGMVERSWAIFPELRGGRPFTFQWYLEARGRGQAQRTWGTAVMTDASAGLQSWDHPEPPRMFREILRGPPARRRHRIPRPG